MYEIILFDLDDTLLDFAKSEHKSLEIIHTEFYSNISFLEFKRNYKTINSQLWERVGSTSNPLKPSDVRLQRFLEINEKFDLSVNHELIADTYEEHLGESAEWFPNVKEAIHFLNEQGYKLGIVTNGLVSVQYRKYELQELSKWFKCFVVSDKVNVSKPQKRIFDIAFSEILSQGELHSIDLKKVLMVGDSPAIDGNGSKNAGIDFCCVGRDNHEGIIRNLEIPVKYSISSVGELPNCLGHQEEYSAFLQSNILPL